MGIYGGTFDPPHEAHLRLLESVLKDQNFEKIFIVPSKFPPGKTAIAPYELRMDWAKKIFTRSEFIVSDFEARSPHTVFGVDIAYHILGRNPDAEISWILGEDQFNQLNYWVRADDYADRLSWIVLRREKVNSSSIRGILSKRLQAKTCAYYWANTPVMAEVSSSDIRKEVREKGAEASTLRHIPQAIREDVLKFYKNTQYRTDDT